MDVSQFEKIEIMRRQTAKEIASTEQPIREILSTRMSILELTLNNVKQSAMTVRLDTRRDNQKRDKRGLIDGIGQVGKYLFGIATSEDLNQISRKMDHLARGEDRILHLETHLLSLASESTTALTAQRKVLQDIQGA